MAVTASQVLNKSLDKFNANQRIFNHLYGPALAYENTVLAELILKNALLIQSTHRSFSYKGIDYSIDETPVPLRRNRLHPDFREKMDKWIEDRKAVLDYEQVYVKSYITSALNITDNLTDYFKLFPSSLHMILQSESSFPTTGEKALSPETVEEFKTKFKTGLDLLKRRLIQNLIT